MSDAPARPNQFRHARAVAHLSEYRDGRWRTYEPPTPVAHCLRGRTWKLRPGLTFTPYANPTSCNAHCAFCSEELLRRDADRLSAKTLIGDRDQYFEGLDRAWRELAGFPVGLSLSGLEATADAAWMLRLLDLVARHEGLFPTKVLYSNGSGLCTHPALVDALAARAFDRVELSRCHFDEAVNQRVMRFERDQPVWRTEAFEGTVRAVAARVPVKLVCVLARGAVETLDDVEAYVARAAALGVDRVVFRELSALGDVYVDNRETRWIAEHRASSRALMDAVLPDDGAPRAGWRFVGVTAGYYYYNEVYAHRGVEVTLEASDYVAHDLAQRTGVIQKLVFHSTGDLCGDWVPNARVIGNYFW